MTDPAGAVNESNAAVLVERAEIFTAKTKKAVSKFQFAQAEQLLAQAHLLFEQAALLCPMQNRGLEDFKDTPPAKRYWIDFSRKPQSTVDRLRELSEQLGCDCKPVSCMCTAASSEVVNYKTDCWACDEQLPLQSEGNWVEAKQLWLCFICNDILYDMLYPEFSAAGKIAELIDDAYWFATPPAEYAEACARISQACQWAEESKTFAHAEIRSKPLKQR
jgi:hypothetical protein